VSPHNFRPSGSILTKLFPDDVPRVRGDKMGISLGRPAPYNLGERKKRPKFGSIFDNFQLWSRISPEWINISQIRTVFYQLHPLPSWMKDIWWTSVHSQKSYRGSYWPTQADIFRETTFRPLGGASTQIFTRVTDLPRLASAHQNCEGAPPKKFNRENLKFGLKFSVWAPITSALVGVSSQNFFGATCCKARW